jgi:transcriptional regulator with XRE-family HTH domain
LLKVYKQFAFGFFITMYKRYNISLQEISKRSIRTPISVKYNRNIILLQGGEFMDARNNDFDFDFTPIGQAIKKARTAKGMTREQLARIVDYDPRHLQAIENEGQKPSLELLIQLVTMFGVSVDEYIFPDNEVKRSSVRRRLDAELDKLNDKELSIVEATVSGLCKAKEPEE